MSILFRTNTEQLLHLNQIIRISNFKFQFFFSSDDLERHYADLQPVPWEPVGQFSGGGGTNNFFFQF